MTKILNKDYWDTIGKKIYESNNEDLWRAHMKEVYQYLINLWMDGLNGGILLKTDLYDEAVTEHSLVSLLVQRCKRVIGADASFEVAFDADKRLSEELKLKHNAVVSDIRNSPFSADSIDQIVSNSTLDHFPTRDDITESIKEIRRILKPGGVLIITLDNPSNPVVYLRNLLSYRLLKLSGVIPFYMGKTLSIRALVNVLESTGFCVYDCTAIDHSPRIITIWIGCILEKTGCKRFKTFFLRLLRLFELLERLPTRYLTGYFIAVKAIKKK